MKITVLNHYTEKENTVDGDVGECLAWLDSQYPWLKVRGGEPLVDVLDDLAHNQAFEVYTEGVSGLESEEEQEKTEADHIKEWLANNRTEESGGAVGQMDRNNRLKAFLKAGAFMSSKDELSYDDILSKLTQDEENPEAVVLCAYELEPTKQNIDLLTSLAKLDSPETSFSKSLESLSDVKPATESASAMASTLNYAIARNQFRPISLRGKHSRGVWIVDTDGGEVLLKPGSGKDSPARGVREIAATQSAREAAFYNIAQKLGLGHYVPQSELLKIHGTEVAAIRFMPKSWGTLDELKYADRTLPRKILSKYKHNGDLFKWSVLDWIFGSADRHGRNIMVGPKPDYSVMLIDHGSSFAGDSFRPGQDDKSFIPYYLRAWSPKSWSKIDINEKLSYMPRMADDSALKNWILNINSEEVTDALKEYGIDPKPFIKRLDSLKEASRSEEPVDLYLNRLWIS